VSPPPWSVLLVTTRPQFISGDRHAPRTSADLEARHDVSGARHRGADLLLDGASARWGLGQRGGRAACLAAQRVAALIGGWPDEAAAIDGLKQAQRPEARVPPTAEDDVVVEGDAERRRGLLHLPRHRDVRLGRGRIAARVVVHDFTSSIKMLI